MKAEYVDHMGTDLSVVNAARVSFDKMSVWESVSHSSMTAMLDDVSIQDYTWVASGNSGYYIKLSERDAKLIHYLAKHKHWTPFAHTSISLRMQAPVPIRTQCFKHKQGFVENEESRRYISSRPELFVPDAFRAAPTNGAKQGSGGVHPKSDKWLNVYEHIAFEAIEAYEYMIAEGVCPEQARFILPQGCEVNWIWTGNVYAFANFYLKRTDPHAQKEIRDLAEMVGEIVQPLFPVSWGALVQRG